MFTTCEEASKEGNYSELKRLHENGYPWDSSTPANAAINGHLECLKYAHENGCPWDNYTPSNAAKNGHLECLKYAHENGCRWTGLTPANAAKKGHLDCLKYAHENGCKWDIYTPTSALIYRQLECFKYCFEKWGNSQEVLDLEFYELQDATKDYLEDYLNNIIIDLDDPVWRSLLNDKIVLSKYPELQQKVNNKKEELQKIKEESMKVLINHLPKDIIKYCLHSML